LKNYLLQYNQYDGSKLLLRHFEGSWKRKALVAPCNDLYRSIATIVQQWEKRIFVIVQ